MADVDASEEGCKSSQSECEVSAEGPTQKKKFVVPQVSVPVNVLEATTFFQVAASGGTNP